MPFPGITRNNPLQQTQTPARSTPSQQEHAGTASSQRPARPQLSGLPQAPRTVGNVQDHAKLFFAKTIGTSAKVVKASETPEMQALRSQPATQGSIRRLAKWEDAYANGPGTATTADRIAAAAGYARNGAAHMVASTAALGANGLAGADAADYLSEHIENLTSKH